MTGHEAQLIAFLAGELPESDAEAFDTHLLRCDQCWTAIREHRAGEQAARLLRVQPPPELADRIRDAITTAAAIPGALDTTRGLDSKNRPTRKVVVRRGALGLVAAAIITAAVAVVGQPPPSHQPPVEPGVTAGSSPQPDAPRSGALTALGQPVIEAAAGHRVTIDPVDTADGEALVATSPAMFPMPPDGVAVSASGMAWTARRGGVTLYCLNNEHPSVLLAGTHGLESLLSLAQRLHLDR